MQPLAWRSQWGVHGRNQKTEAWLVFNQKGELQISDSTSEGIVADVLSVKLAAVSSDSQEYFSCDHLQSRTTQARVYE